MGTVLTLLEIEEIMHTLCDNIKNGAKGICVSCREATYTGSCSCDNDE